MSEMPVVYNSGLIEQVILLLRGQKVILDRDLAAASRCQFGTLKRGQNIKHLPYAFTEQGVSMLSSVLRSPQAVQVNIAIMEREVK